MSINCRLSKYNKLSIKSFYSRDNFNYSLKRYSTYISTSFDTDIFDDFDMILNNNWNNNALTAILKTIITPQIILKTQAYSSRFSSKNISRLSLAYFDEETSQNIKVQHETNFSNQIQDLCVQSELQIKASELFFIKFGGEYHDYYFNNIVKLNAFEDIENTKEPYIATGFLENKLSIRSLIIRAGIRSSKYKFRDNFDFEPRLNLALNMPWGFKLKAAFGKYYQYIISINSQDYEIIQFIDNYYPLTNRKPSTSYQYIAGVEKGLNSKSFLSVDVYYNNIEQSYMFNYNVIQDDALNFSDNIISGSGKAYGIEFLWKGSLRKYSGWLSYGISRSVRNYESINNGESFLYDFDRPHSFKAISKL